MSILGALPGRTGGWCRVCSSEHEDRVVWSRRWGRGWRRWRKTRDQEGGQGRGEWKARRERRLERKGRGVVGRGISGEKRDDGDDVDDGGDVELTEGIAGGSP